MAVNLQFNGTENINGCTAATIESFCSFSKLFCPVSVPRKRMHIHFQVEWFTSPGDTSYDSSNFFICLFIAEGTSVDTRMSQPLRATLNRGGIKEG